MQNFGTIIDNFDAVTKQYVDDKASAKRIRSIKVENADVADTANKVKNAFTYKAHDKAAGTVLPITYNGRQAASLDFSANDFTYDYNSFNDIKIKLAEDVKTSLGKADTALQNVPSYNDLPNIPVINQDLSASGFTPVANTYYRHTGATTDTFRQGVIYLYNGTGYAALGESGSGGGKSYELVTARVALTSDVSGGRRICEVPADVYSPSANFAMWLYERALPGRWRLIITNLDTREGISLTPCYPLYDKHWYGGINDTGEAIHGMVFSSETSYDMKTGYYTTTRLYEVDVKQNTIAFYNDRLVKEVYTVNKGTIARKDDTPFNKSGNISVILEYTILSEVAE